MQKGESEHSLLLSPTSNNAAVSLGVLSSLTWVESVPEESLNSDPLENLIRPEPLGFASGQKD